jgi:hypothetical protein
MKKRRLVESARIADLEQSGSQSGGKEARHEKMHGSVPIRRF